MYFDLPSPNLPITNVETTTRRPDHTNKIKKMGLVDYSDSESDGDFPSVSAPPSKPAASQSAAKQQPFQKLVDKTNPAKILVNLPSAASAANDTLPADDNPAKRRKIGASAGGGGGRFGGFSSFLPAPKATTISRPPGGSGTGKAAPPRVGVNLKTSSEAAFSRDEGDDRAAGDGNNSTGELPAPKASAQPSIPEGQKPADEVKLVGNPLMFRPLSVARRPGKKNGGVKAVTNAPPKAVGTQGAAASGPPTPTATSAQKETPQAAAPPKRKKVSLFSMTDDTPSAVEAAPEESVSYEPEFNSYDNDIAFTDGYASYDTHQHQQQHNTGYAQPQAPTGSSADPNSLDSIADDLNLSAAARRELFGRGGPSTGDTARSVINFNLDQEYRHNEELRTSGALDSQKHNPVRAIKPGKHSLQQLVSQVQSQRDALEDNFAKNRSTQKSAGAKYGFR